MAVSADDFNDVREGFAEAAAFAGGDADLATYRVHVPATVDEKALRKRLGLT